MGQSLSKSSSTPRITATFPGDPDHGKVVVKQTNTVKAPKRNILRKKTRCFMDIEIDGESAGRIIFELRPDVAPRACENFRALCSDHEELSYQGCKFHKIVPEFILQTGDVELKGQKKEGTGGLSIYGRSFADESLDQLSHAEYGVVSMANSGPHTNNSQFMIVIDRKGADWLDGKHTIIGKVSSDSFDALERIEACAEVFERDEKKRARIIKTCIISGCGQL